MSILSTNKKLVRVGYDYSAGENIGINDCIISSRNWSPDITYAAESAFQRATGYADTQINALSGEVSAEVSQLSSDIEYISGVALTAHQSLEGYATEDWVTAQGYITGVDLTPYYTTAEADSLSSMLSGAIDYVSANADNVEVTNVVQSNSGTWNEVTNKLDATAFSDVSGSFLTAHQSLDNYYTKDETSGKEELADAFSNIPVGDPEVNAYVTSNSAAIDESTNLVQSNSSNWNDVTVYQSNSANYLTAHQDLSDYYTTAEADSLSSMFSGAIDYVSANATDPNALTGYQTSAVEISANGNFFEVSGFGYNVHVGEGGRLNADNSCSAVFTNGSKFINTNGGFISADGSCGFATSAGSQLLSAERMGFVASSNNYDLRLYGGCKISASNGASAVFTSNGLLSADGWNGFLASGKGYCISASDINYGFELSSYGALLSSYQGKILLSSNNDNASEFRNPKVNISAGGGGGLPLNISSNSVSALLYWNGLNLSSNYCKASIGAYASEEFGGIGSTNGIGFSSHYGSQLEVFNSGKLKVYNNGKLEVANVGNLSAQNYCSAIFTNGSRTEITNGHTLLVGNNDKGTGHGIIVSGIGNEFIKIYNGGSVKAIDGAELNLSGVTHKIGQSLNASGSRFVSADSEDVSAWAAAPMTVMGAYNDTSSNAAFVIGNGYANAARSDLFVIDYSGNAQTNDFVAGNGNKLSDSIQHSELEFDGNDAITAINGSAIGGGGSVTGEFVPQSAFDELKQSYDALSSLFATYSGQWLLPNEGEE